MENEVFFPLPFYFATFALIQPISLVSQIANAVANP